MIYQGKKACIMAGIDLLCDICDEIIPVQKNENTSRAFARHSQSPYHLEIAERFRAIKLGGIGNHVFSSSGDTPQNEVSCDSCVTVNSSLFYCRLCKINVNDSAAMAQHMKAEKHLILESFVRDVNLQRDLLKLMGFSLKQTSQVESNKTISYFSNMNLNETRVCLVCNSTVFADVNLWRHLKNDQNHLSKLNSLFINWGRNYSFYCILCNVGDCKGAEEHCGSDVHRNAISQIFEYAQHGTF